ncbi:MAG: DMT family transporter [Candidatus Hodarchaeales archaeon]|jgi:drug/metabolite transporter (DMT)-like permease
MEITFSREYLRYLLQAVFVTVLWSSSWVIIKFGLEDLTPLYFAGFRYLVGSITLMMLLIANSDYRISIKSQSKKSFAYLSVYGVLFITLTQGGQFLALSLLPAITVSFLLNLSSFIVIILSLFILSETPSRFELILFLFVFVGIIIYFFPQQQDITSILGLLIGVGVVFVNAFSSIIGRAINRESNKSPLVVTGVSMAIGTVFLLIIAVITEPLPVISIKSLITILWLGVVNTAIAFTLWNNAMTKIRAMDMSVINSLMLPQIVILSIIFLGELPLLNEWVGLIIMVSMTFILQLSQARVKNSNEKAK